MLFGFVVGVAVVCWLLLGVVDVVRCVLSLCVVLCLMIAMQIAVSC